MENMIQISSWQVPRRSHLGVVWIKVNGVTKKQIYTRGFMAARKLSKELRENPERVKELLND